MLNFFYVYFYNGRASLPNSLLTIVPTALYIANNPVKIPTPPAILVIIIWFVKSPSANKINNSANDQNTNLVIVLWVFVPITNSHKECKYPP